MKNMCGLLFLLVYSLVCFRSACGLHEVALHGENEFSEGYAERYGAVDAAGTVHSVWLYTRAACDSIRWTLGDRTHGERLACGTAAGFMGVPEGVHHAVIEGCGKRIAAYLSVTKDLHVMIEPSDLKSGGSCGDVDSPGEGGGYYVDFIETVRSISFISDL